MSVNTYYTRKWWKWGLINLAIVALYGTLMRYKIAFDFPFFDQKNLLHAHSHFAFSGWVSHMLYTGLYFMLAGQLSLGRQKVYNRILQLNIFCAYGMLLFFTVQGYKAVSICFSTLSIIIAVLYAAVFIKDVTHVAGRHPSKPWAVAGLLLNILSSAGPLSLAYMMVSKNINSHFYLGSVYYYLHFQYSGWFFFGTMALITSRLPESSPSLKKYYNFFAITVIPTFFLSILWAKLPMWLYTITVAATMIQLVVWVLMLIKLWRFRRQQPDYFYPHWINIFFYAAATALTLKFLLQAASVIPSLSQLVFGIRPIVIAYLHLVLLGVYSLFFMGFLFATRVILTTSTAKCAAFLFLAGVVLNEALLAVQGFAAFAYVPVPLINPMLFVAAVVLLSSAALLAASQFSGMNVRQ